jgi:uncharacterized glyoxalase superfamily protein PhnB
VWPCINYRDAVAAIEFLTGAFGFQSTLVHEDGGHIRHAELRWPEGGGIMVGSESPDGTPFERLPTGSSGLYVVTDDPDTVFERATRAGATVIHGLKDEDYGSRGFTVADPEGNLWSFGTYRGS